MARLDSGLKAVEGVLRGLVEAQGIKRGRKHELEDQAAAQQRLVQQLQLQAALAEAAQNRRFSQENLAREDTQAFQAQQGQVGREFAGQQSELERALRASLGILDVEAADVRQGRDLSSRRELASAGDKAAMDRLLVSEEGRDRRSTESIQGMVDRALLAANARAERLTSASEGMLDALLSGELRKGLPVEAQKELENALLMGKGDPASLISEMVSRGFVKPEDAINAREALRQQFMGTAVSEEEAEQDALIVMMEELAELKRQALELEKARQASE